MARSRVSRHERSRRTAAALLAASAADAEERRRLREEVVLLNLPVAEAVAQRYRNRGIDSEDLQQVAYEALVKAVDRFDVHREHDFLSFAVPTIRGEVMRHFRDLGWMVRPPRRLQELQRAIHRAIEELSADGHQPAPSEIVEHLRLSRAEYDQAVMAFGTFSPVSLDRRVSDETTTTLGDLVPADDSEARGREARIVLEPLLRALSAREQRILLLRYHADLTQQEIGEEFGVTQMQVSRILAKVHQRLRAGLAGGAPHPN